jgi:hypothetical protein
MKSLVRVIGGGGGAGGVVGDNFKMSPGGAVRKKTNLLFVLLPCSLSLLIDFLARLPRITNQTTFSFTLNSMCWLVFVLRVIQLPFAVLPPVRP